MDWLRDPQNPYFAKAIVNRVWAEYFGVGIVNPPDDLSLANAPSNAALLDYLERGFVESGYDLKWLHRQIVLSDTYQRSWRTNETNAQDRRNFSHFLLRRLPAEAAYDAVRMALANDAYRQKMADLEVSRALTLAGASARSNGRDAQSYALTVFGRSVRESNCDCDRSNEPSLLQTVFMVNDPAIQEWLYDARNGWVAQVAKEYGWAVPQGRSNNRQAMEQQARAQRQIANMEKQLKSLRQRLQQARKDDNRRLVEQLEQRQQRIQQQIARFSASIGRSDEEATPSTGGPTSPTRLSEKQVREVVQQAYLRTLSRLPTEEELRTVIDHMLGEESPVEGLASVMWSLINTKEFQLNH
ncbi:MAG: hypothetical protein KatS3mg111_2797 [Pirellulaceae bacterium]|nr:MAG: hypothetical protein KatS3mg111_2797 [Pirellulaceae bacterium]